MMCFLAVEFAALLAGKFDQKLFAIKFAIN
jgi:hypothetical protein